jgi:hypothetical protein
LRELFVRPSSTRWLVRSLVSASEALERAPAVLVRASAVSVAGGPARALPQERVRMGILLPLCVCQPCPFARSRVRCARACMRAPSVCLPMKRAVLACCTELPRERVRLAILSSCGAVSVDRARTSIEHARPLCVCFTHLPSDARCLSVVLCAISAGPLLTVKSCGQGIFPKDPLLFVRSFVSAAVWGGEYAPVCARAHVRLLLRACPASAVSISAARSCHESD